MSPRQYVTAARVEQLADRLTARDRAIIETLDRLRVATTSQLQRLHFTGGTPLANARQARRTLRRLVESDVLARLDRRVGGGTRGSSQAVYALSVAGQRLASACGPAGGSRLRRPWTPHHSFLAHQLSVTEVFVELSEAEASGDCELLAFDAEPLSWRRFTGLAGARTILKPDTYLRLGLGEYEDAYFLEIDRATESLPTLARKLDTYRRYRQTGREQQRYGVFPQALFLVPDQARKQALVDLLGNQPAETWQLHRVSLASEALSVLLGRET